MVKFSGLVACAIIMAPVGAFADLKLPYLAATTTASYGSGLTDSKFLQFPAVSLPVSLQSRSHIPLGGATEYVYGDKVVAWDGADGYAYADVPGMDGAYARAGGKSLVPGAKPKASAVLTRMTNWVATGPTARTTVDLFTFFDGFFYTSYRTEDGVPIKSSMEISVELQSSLGFKRILSGLVILNAANGISLAFTASNGWSNGTWIGSFKDMTSLMPRKNGNDRLWVQSYSENISNIVEVPVGEVFSVKYQMALSAVNDVGPYHNYATVDYSNTTDFEMRTSRPGYSVKEVNLVVPEPTSLVAIGVGCVATLRGRRRGIKAEKR